MYSLNRAQIIGNLTRDIEVRNLPSGQPVCSFGVATNRRWTNQAGEQQEATEFHNVVAFGKLAEIVSQILKKGKKVYIEGRLQTHSWEGQDGAKRQRTEIVMENFVPLSPKETGAAESTFPNPEPVVTDGAEKDEKEDKKSKKSESKVETPADKEDINLDDIPF